MFDHFLEGDMSQHHVDQRPHILFIDDDEGLRTHVVQYLSEQGFMVTVKSDGSSVEAVLNESRIDLIILDVMLPGEDGLSICRRLSEAGAPPVIMLSAMGDEVDRIVGLEIGAADYLPKPCAPRELLARVRAVLRRNEHGRLAAMPKAFGGLSRLEIKFEGFRLDLVRRRLYAPNGTAIVLTNSEFCLIAVFLENPDIIMSRIELARQSGVGDPDDIDRAIDIQIGRLRRKLCSYSDFDPIETVRGYGYIFRSGPVGLRL
jgi:two-component system OmpR family response regulator